MINISKLASELLVMALKKKDKEISNFSISDFKTAFNKKNVSTLQFFQSIKAALMTELCKITLYSENQESAFLLLKKINLENENIKLTFNKEALGNIQEIKPYEIIEFEKAAKLKSRHAFNIYKYALSKQGFSGKSGNKEKSWWFELEIGLLKAYLGVSTQDYARVRDFQLRCLTQPINEINKANIGIEISYSSIKIKKKIVAFRFDCKELSQKLKIEKTDSLAEKQEKQVINEDWAKEALWEKMQKAHPRIWKKYFDEEKSKSLFVFDPVAKNSVYERMLSEGYKI